MAYALDRTRDTVFVERLHAKTMARALNWTPTKHSGRYEVGVGDYVVEIGEADEGGFEILICEADGHAIEILTPDLLGEPGGEGQPARRHMMQETFDAARRQALGVDAVIEHLIVRLSGASAADEPASEAQPARAGEPHPIAHLIEVLGEAPIPDEPAADTDEPVADSTEEDVVPSPVAPIAAEAVRVQVAAGTNGAA